jgi:putative ABC transport system substrate-binding protein
LRKTLSSGADNCRFEGCRFGRTPVEQSVVFEPALNLKTAAALGLTIPDHVMARVDKLIE